MNVDAHFDGKFEDRLKLIETMSYYDITKITKGYVDIIWELMPEVRGVQDALQKDLDNSMSKFENQWIRYLNSEMLRNKSEMI